MQMYQHILILRQAYQPYHLPHLPIMALILAGTAAGAGIINAKNHGMAAKATIVNQFFSDIIVYAPSYITDYNMVVTNNSYHSAEAGCAG